MKNKISLPSMIGGSSLLVIFAVLCLTVFAMLALTTVQAEKRLADASAEGVAEYYQADLQAEIVFAQLRSGQICEEVTRQEDTYRFVCPVSEKQDLQVELQQQQGRWEVLRWQVVAYPEITNDDAPMVWDGF